MSCSLGDSAGGSVRLVWQETRSWPLSCAGKAHPGLRGAFLALEACMQIYSFCCPKKKTAKPSHHPPMRAVTRVPTYSLVSHRGQHGEELRGSGKMDGQVQSRNMLEVTVVTV